jgi:hypothetical protein
LPVDKKEKENEKGTNWVGIEFLVETVQVEVSQEWQLFQLKRSNLVVCKGCYLQEIHCIEEKGKKFFG